MTAAAKDTVVRRRDRHSPLKSQSPAVTQRGGESESPTGPASNLRRVATDIPYHQRAQHISQKLDIYYHDNSTTHTRSGEHRMRRPVAVWLHGGGWVSGDKRGAASHPLLQVLHRRFGWVIVALNFRQVPTLSNLSALSGLCTLLPPFLPLF